MTRVANIYAIARQCAEGLSSLSATDRELLERRIRDVIVGAYSRGRRNKEAALPAPTAPITTNQENYLLIIHKMGRGTIKKIHAERHQDGWSNKTMAVLDRMVDMGLVERSTERPSRYTLTGIGVRKAVAIETRRGLEGSNNE